MRGYHPSVVTVVVYVYCKIWIAFARINSFSRKQLKFLVFYTKTFSCFAVAVMSSSSPPSSTSGTTSFKDIYLILFNNACTTGWGMVWCMALYGIITHIQMSVPALSKLTTAPTDLPILVVTTIANGLRSIYHSNELFSSVLVMSQCMALLEIVHALLGMVKSPVLVTAMQVMSRIVALVAIYYSPNAQSRCFVFALSDFVAFIVIVDDVCLTQCWNSFLVHSLS